jgi:hypothetical protein
MLGLIQVQHLSRHGTTRYVHGAIGWSARLQKSCDGDTSPCSAKEMSVSASPFGPLRPSNAPLASDKSHASIAIES